jgi:hypothetical protein
LGEDRNWLGDVAASAKQCRGQFLIRWQRALESQAGNRLDVSDGLLGAAALELSTGSQNEHLVRGLRLFLDDHGTAYGHDDGEDAIDALGAFVHGGVEVAGGVLAGRFRNGR